MKHYIPLFGQLTELKSSFEIFIGLAGLSGIALGIFYITKGKVAEQTIKGYKELTDSQEQRIQDNDRKLEELKTKLTSLENELNVVKTLPLTQLSTDYHKINDTLNMVAEILKNQQIQLDSMLKTTKIRKVRKMNKI